MKEELETLKQDKDTLTHLIKQQKSKLIFQKEKNVLT